MPPRLPSRSALLVLVAACRPGAAAEPATRPSTTATIPSPAVTDTGEQTCGGRRGRERWAIKTLSDRQRDRVRLDSIIPVTIERLVALDPPPRTSRYRRMAPVETTVYRVEAYLVDWSLERDGDYHLVLASVRDPSVTMVAEVPDLACEGACRSGYAAQFARIRQQVVQRVEAGRMVQARGPGPRVTVVGIGFFDREHRQHGAAPNQIELHPELSLRFH